MEIEIGIIMFFSSMLQFAYFLFWGSYIFYIIFHTWILLHLTWSFFLSENILAGSILHVYTNWNCCWLRLWWSGMHILNNYFVCFEIYNILKAKVLTILLCWFTFLLPLPFEKISYSLLLLISTSHVLNVLIFLCL